MPGFLVTVCVMGLALAGQCPGGEQTLIPWASLGGKPHPDEAVLDTADWTTQSRESLAPRVVRKLVDNWKFNYFPQSELDTAKLQPAANDADWRVVALPHTWQSYETKKELHPFIASFKEQGEANWWNGWGLYRNCFVMTAEMIGGRRVFVEFDGVMKYSRVWVNGKEVGDHKGGYASFSFDITKWLKPGTNMLAVAVNTRQRDEFNTPPMTAGNFNGYGGIYRDVRLVLKHAVHIPFQGSAEHEGGTFVTTPKVSAGEASVRVRTWVKNDGAKACSVSLRTDIVDPAGQRIARNEVSAEVAAGVIHGFDQPEVIVARPHLWSIEKPTLYRVESEVRVNGEATDRYASPLGFRWFEWNKEENLGYLNGKRLHLHGTNRHQEFPWLGDAIPKWMHVRDMADMRFGQSHNFLRTAHYTQDPLVYDLADRYGMLVCEEVPSIKNMAFSPEIQRQQVIEMVRRDRNHPAIVMWSMGNETSHPADSKWAHDEDDTRIIHVRHGDMARAGAFITHTDKQMDMENLLRCTVRGWTHREVADFEPKSGQSTGTEEWQCAMAKVMDGSQRGRIDMPNGNMWLYADHGACRTYANCPLLYLNPKGWVDIYRIPKYMYYLWQANYHESPMVFVHPHFWQNRYLGQKRDIAVDSNCASVELFVNNRSVGRLQPGAKEFWSVTFPNVPVERGELRAVAKMNGRETTCRVTMADEPASLTVAASHSAIAASRASVVLLTADAVDKAGVHVQEFSRDLRWTVSGPATLVTPEVYTTDIKKVLGTLGSFYIVTPVCALVRSTGAAGEITVTVGAEGVAPAVLKLHAR